MATLSAAGYAGDVTAGDAWKQLQADPKAVLVDVRSEAEWTFVGVPDLSSVGKRVVQVAWQKYPGMALNQNFSDDLRKAGVSADQSIYFLCRSGGRSRSAAQAMTMQGFNRCFNVLGGFEGDLDPARHRGNAGGWKAEGLPWIQS